MAYSELIVVGNVTFTTGSVNATTSGIVLSTSGIVAGDAIVTPGNQWLIDFVNTVSNILVLADAWTGSNTTIPLKVLKMSPSRWSPAQTAWYSREAYQRLLLASTNATNFRVKGLLNTPPGLSAEGDQWVLNTAPTGVWAGQASKIALYSNSQWNFTTPTNGDTANFNGAIYSFNGTSWILQSSLTASVFGLSLIDDIDAATARTTMGLGTMSTQGSGAVTITGGNITGITDLAIADGGTGASNASTARTNLGISATNTPYTAGGNIVATNVQAAIQELDSEKIGTTGTWSMTGVLSAGGFTVGGVSVCLQNRQVTAGTGLSGGGDLSTNRTLTFDTTWGDARYVTKASPSVTANVTVTVDGARVNINRASGGVQTTIGVDFQNNGSSVGQFLYNFSSDAFTLNKGLIVTGAFSATLPVKVPTYLKSALPSAATYGAGSLIYVSDDTLGATLAFCDGTNWRRCHDRTTVA